MLTKYMVHAMTREDFDKWLKDDYDYHIIKLFVLAENPYEATTVAEHEHPDLVIRSYVKTVKNFS